jgi:hypothetical protein
MFGGEESTGDLAWLAVPLAGALEETGDRWLPFRLTDPAGATVEAVSAFFGDLQAAGRPEATPRSYGHDLLRWFRFLWAVEVPWARGRQVITVVRKGTRELQELPASSDAFVWPRLYHAQRPQPSRAGRR